MRNHRGLKPFQLARANGHNSISCQLCDTRSTRARQDRRRRNAEGGVGGGGGTGRSSMTPEALLTMLIQVAGVGTERAKSTGVKLLHGCWC